MSRTPEQQKAFEQLDAFGLFFGADDDEPDLTQTLNLNDVWAWALADGLHVPDEDLPELAYLFFEYGWGGVLYYADVRQGGQGSQFFHYQRAIEYARHEEQIRAELPDPSQRAFSSRSYTLGDPQPREKGTTFGPDADSYNHVFGCESPPRADESAPQPREEQKP